MLSMPQRGQAISYNDLYDIVENINTLNAQLVPKTSDSSFLGPNKDSDNRNISKSVYAAVVAQVKNPGQNRSVNDKDDFRISFGTTFKTPPVVTITVQAGTGADGSGGNTLASYRATAVITSISTTDVSGYVIYPSEGKATNSLHVIAIGIPNS